MGINLNRPAEEVTIRSQTALWREVLHERVGAVLADKALLISSVSADSEGVTVKFYLRHDSDVLRVLAHLRGVPPAQVG